MKILKKIKKFEETFFSKNSPEPDPTRNNLLKPEVGISDKKHNNFYVCSAELVKS